MKKTSSRGRSILIGILIFLGIVILILGTIFLVIYLRYPYLLFGFDLTLTQNGTTYYLTSDGHTLYMTTTKPSIVFMVNRLNQLTSRIKGTDYLFYYTPSNGGANGITTTANSNGPLTLTASSSGGTYYLSGPGTSCVSIGRSDIAATDAYVYMAHSITPGDTTFTSCDNTTPVGINGLQNFVFTQVNESVFV